MSAGAMAPEASSGWLRSRSRAVDPPAPLPADGESVVRWIQCGDRLAGAHGLSFVRPDRYDLSRHFEADVDAWYSPGRCRSRSWTTAVGGVTVWTTTGTARAIVAVGRARVGAGARGGGERA